MYPTLHQQLREAIVWSSPVQLRVALLHLQAERLASTRRPASSFMILLLPATLEPLILPQLLSRPDLLQDSTLVTGQMQRQLYHMQHLPLHRLELTISKEVSAQDVLIS